MDRGSVGDCAEFYDGRVFDDVDDVPHQCNLGDELIALGMGSEDCLDGGMQWWNQVAWGFIDEPARLHEQPAPWQTPPDDVVARCADGGRRSE